MKIDQDNEYFCILPWVHLSLGTTGIVKTCCRSSSTEGLGNFRDSSLKEIWNNKKYNNIRLDMLAGKKISDCNDCYQQEANGNGSLRINSNLEFQTAIEELGKTNKDGSLNDFNPSYLDLRFSNICNFKCRTCGTDYSTAWYSDYTELGIKKVVPEFIISEKSEALWAELVLLLPRIKKIYFAGGEPLMHSDHYRLLKELIKLNLTSVVLVYNTNLSVLKFGDNSILEIWSKFKNITICASLDGIGKQGEFIRKGFNWDIFFNNKNEIEKRLPDVHFKIYWTASIYNSFHIIEVFKFIIENNFLKNGNDFEVNILNDPKIYNIKVLNTLERERLISSYNEFTNVYLKENIFPDSDNLVKILNYLVNYLSDDEFTSERIKFWALNRKLDKIRNEKSELLFPELVALFNVPFAETN